METVGAVLTRTEVICGILSFLGVVFGYLTVRVTAARERANNQAAIEKAAQEAREKVKVEAEKNAVDAWHSIAGEYKDQVNKLTQQNADQQKQIDCVTAKVEECEEHREECEEQHKQAIRRLEAVEGTVTKIANGNQ